MLNFANWLENVETINEARGVTTGGAFGKAKPKFRPYKSNIGIGQYSHSKQDQNTLSPSQYAQRISFGLTQEDKIMKAAQGCGMNISPSTPYEDKNLGIDGWWNVDGKKLPVQIKYREKGQGDALFEVINPYVRDPILGPHNGLGRDVKYVPEFRASGLAKKGPNEPGGPKYILHLNPGGNLLSVIETAPSYSDILNMLRDIDANGWSNPHKKIHTTPKGIVRWQTDASTGVQKLIAYLPVHNTKIIKQCQVDVQIG